MRNSVFVSMPWGMLFVFVFFSTPALQAAPLPDTFYVSPSGVDDISRDGSGSEPWHHINYALSRSEVGNGDIIVTYVLRHIPVSFDTFPLYVAMRALVSDISALKSLSTRLPASRHRSRRHQRTNFGDPENAGPCIGVGPAAKGYAYW